MPEPRSLACPCCGAGVSGGGLVLVERVIVHEFRVRGVAGNGLVVAAENSLPRDALWSTRAIRCSACAIEFPLPKTMEVEHAQE